MRLDTHLPSIFTSYNCCLLDAFALSTKMTPPRTVIANSGFTTILSPMKASTLRLRLDGELYAFGETGGSVRYLPQDATAVPNVVERIDPGRMVAIHVIKAPSTLTLLLIEETTSKASQASGKPIAVIGDRIHWDLSGVDVQFQMLHASLAR